MGKRKLHEQTYFQCDWTGLPMRGSNCYMPHWKEGKLVKHGSYANWECVVADIATQDELDAQLKQDMLQHIYSVVGTTVQEAPHWSKLQWFSREEAGGITEEEFHRLCFASDNNATCVVISPTGELANAIIDPTTLSDTWQKFVSQRATRKKLKDRDIEVFYKRKGAVLNSTASTVFKMQIYGECVVFCKTKESSLVPRQRYVPLTIADFTEQFTTKRKREADGLTVQQYSELHSEMQESLCAFEARASASSQCPQDLARAAVMPPASGEELAALAAEIHPGKAKQLQEKLAQLEQRMAAPLSTPVAAH